METVKSPDIETDSEDKGDVTQQRFRFQNTYAAIASCAILMNVNVDKVYCEHHEDVLVRFCDGLFEGIQVKTRESHLPGFTFSDPAMTNTILRFVKLELKYPGLFKSYKIVSNSGFARTKNDNLYEIIKIAQSEQYSDLKKDRSKTKKFINETCKKLKCSDKCVISTIAKITLRADYSNLNDIKNKLVDEISRLPKMGDQTLGMLNEIADKLIFRSYNASSKGEEEICEAFLMGKSLEEVNKVAILLNKTITEEHVRKIIDECLKSPISHFLKDENSLFGKAEGNKILEKKLDAGGISTNNVVLLKDQKYSFETYLSQQVYRLSVNKVKPQYNQIQLIINTICQEVHDKYANSDELFGNKMLAEIRTRLKEKFSSGQGNLGEFQYEHLLGMVGVLTEDCKIWWSTHFNISK